MSLTEGLFLRGYLVLFLVGAVGLEPTTLGSQSRYASHLRYAPMYDGEPVE